MNLDEVKAMLKEAVPEAVFGETDYGNSVQVSVPGAQKSWIVSQSFRHGYTGYQLLTKMGAEDVIKGLQVALEGQD